MNKFETGISRLWQFFLNKNVDIENNILKSTRRRKENMPLKWCVGGARVRDVHPCSV